MKRISALLITALLTIALSSCGASAQRREILCSAQVLESFSSCMHPDEILKEFGKIDYGYRPDFSGLTKKTITDNESGDTEQNWYNRKGEKVYSIFDDSAETGFDYFTKSKSGEKMTLSYSYDGDEILWVKASADNYSALFSDISDNTAAGIYIEESVPGSAPEYISYRLSDNKWAAEHAVFYSDDGLVEYFGCSNDGTEDYGTQMLADKTESAQVSDTGGLGDSAPLQFSARSCRADYTESGGVRTWYLTVPFIFQFDDWDSAKAFSAEYNLPKPETDGLYGEIPEIKTGEYTFRVSPGFASSERFLNYITAEINDDYSLILKLDDKGEVTGFDNGWIQFY